MRVKLTECGNVYIVFALLLYFLDNDGLGVFLIMDFFFLVFSFVLYLKHGFTIYSYLPWNLYAMLGWLQT